MPQRHYSHRAGPIDRCTLCLLFRLNRDKYRHRRGMLGPLLHTFLGIPERRTDYRKHRYYEPARRRAAGTSHQTAQTSSHPSAPATKAERPLTLAERHAAEYQHHTPAESKPASATVYSPPSPTPGARAQARQVLETPGAEPRPRRFHDPRPTEQGVKSNVAAKPHGNQRGQPLPRPTGQPPYHLSLDDVLPDDQMNAIRQSGRILFHVAGDTGGVKVPQSQRIVAMAMEAQFQFPDVALRPAFFYHLGDVVYYYGEPKEYYPQFYDPYVHYPAPIFAIPGNHDADLTDGSPPSLTAFVNNFCASRPHVTSEAGETQRDAMTQPNVYWTLEAPFVTMIGLYSNVPEGGYLDDEQVAWFVNELHTAPQDKALIVSVHHPAYSADTYHSGSEHIQQTLDNSFQQAGRLPDVVLTAHVHNYQRFTRELEGQHLPYIVSGAGGYWHLHYMAKDNGKPLALPYKMPDCKDVTLENACDDRHGFIRFMVTPQYVTGEYWGVPRPQESWRAPANRIDGFALDWKSHKLIKGTNLR